MRKCLFSISIFLCSIISVIAQSSLKNGADRLDILLPMLEGKRTALIINQTSCLTNGTHLLDTLISRDVKVMKIFAPEHGIRGNADAGETVSNGKDSKTGITITSLYGRNKKPTAEMLKDVDIVLFDIQDVGARFYTYISTMHYAMEACAEQNKEFIVLDRPNPNDYVDGPVLLPRFKSFVGMHPIPVLHGLTVGELARMINGEGWLAQNQKCKLKVVSVDGWKHGQAYILPVKPSPNLPNNQSIRLYASLCFFESTNVSVGRGTYFPFQVIGSPDTKFGSFTFTPKSLPGFDKSPLLKDKKCYGTDLRSVNFEGGLTLKYLIDFYNKSGLGAKFFTSPRFMDNLAGTDKLRLQITRGLSEDNIRKTWENDLTKYKTIRKKYLLYNENRDN